jgi:hypothetical protein
LWEETVTNTGQPKEEKKVYTKPSLTEIRLVAEEAVLGLCKNGNGNIDECGSALSCTDEAGS